MLKRLLFILFLVASSSQAQEKSFWTARSSNTSKKDLNHQKPKSAYFYLDINGLKKKLVTLDHSLNSENIDFLELDFPSPNGSIDRYVVVENSNFHPELAKKFPKIKSYKGTSIDGKKRIHFSVDALHFQGMLIKQSGKSAFIEALQGHTKEYYVFDKEKSIRKKSIAFKCKVPSKKEIGPRLARKKAVNAPKNDDNLRIFRIAIATTGEYSQYHISKSGLSNNASDAQKTAAVLAGINKTLTRVNEIFQNEFSVRFELIPNNEDIIFFDSATDGFTNNNADKLIIESQDTIEAIIGQNNYDIGHTFSTGGGGFAQFFSVCSNNGRAKGITGSASPEGDEFDIDFVCHEIGHQFGGNHVQNNDDERVFGASVEPGSGSSVMGYAGISIPNVQNASDAYFNSFNIQEMWSFIANLQPIGSCGMQIVASNNTPPTITAPLPDYVIPLGTPFKLTTAASDTEDTGLTYCWEQQDADPAPMPPQGDSAIGPLFRSLPPSTTPTRYFPALGEVLDGSLGSTWEVLPQVPRTMNFTVTVRDNSNNGGGFNIDDTVVQIANTGPFRLTSFNTPIDALSQRTIETVTWDPAGTQGNGIGTSTVNILLSYDGGLTFNTILAANTSNDGDEKVIIPEGPSSPNCRIMIVPTNSIYYAINAVNFGISDNVVGTSVADGVIKISGNRVENNDFEIDFGEKLPTGEVINVQIFNMAGKIMFNKEYKATFSTIIKTHSFSTGIYIVRVERASEIVHFKILVQ